MAEIGFIMGKSASGKDNIYQRIIGDESMKLKTITMYTTRPMRAGETNGLEYHFVDDKTAEELRAAGKVIELRAYNTVYGVWKYFTVDDGQIELGTDKRYLVIGTLEAYNAYCKYFGAEHIMPIYIEVEDGLRLERAIGRERKQTKPAYEEMCRRFLADAADFSEEKLAEAGINRRFKNEDTLERCVEEVKVAIVSELGYNDLRTQS